MSSSNFNKKSFKVDMTFVIFDQEDLITYISELVVKRTQWDPSKNHGQLIHF